MRQTAPASCIDAHTSPSAPATTAGFRAVARRSTTFPVARLIRHSVSSRSHGTQTLPPTTSRLTGESPTFTVLTRFRRRASIFVTDPLNVFETQSVLPFAASQDAPLPPLRTGTSLYVRGSRRYTELP